MRIFVLLIACALSVSAAEQQTPELPSFVTKTTLVVHAVTVKGRDGRAVEGLTEHDFTVTENGEHQDVAFVQFQQLSASADRSGLPTGPLGDARAASTLVAPVTSAQIVAPAPDDARYRSRRLIILYYDLYALPPLDLLRACADSLKYIHVRMSPVDLVAVMAFQKGAVRVEQDFSDNREQLESAVQRLCGAGQDSDLAASNATVDTAFGQDDGEFNLFNNDRRLAALQTAVQMLRPIPEQKTLMYFAGGLLVTAADNEAEYRATVSAAVRANVTVNPIDVRGLVALAPIGDASMRSQVGIGLFSGAAMTSTLAGLERSQDSLYALAKDTGGRALLDSNDLAVGITEAAEAVTSYYLVAYYSTHSARDGRYRRIHIALSHDVGASLSYREGYYGDRTYSNLTRGERDRQLEEAMMLDNPITDIPMAVELNFFQLNRAEYFVPVAVKIPGRELGAANRPDGGRAELTFIGAIKDQSGTTRSNIRDRVQFKVRDAVAGSLAKGPLEYDTGFTLLPGTYVIKLLVRDGQTGRIGTFQRSFAIPDLNKEPSLAISSVILSNQRVALADALYSVGQKASDVVNPLIHDGQKLVPSITRVFSKSRELYVFLQAYERVATTTQPIVAVAAFYLGTQKVLETIPLRVTAGRDPRSGAVPIRFSVPLNDLQSGRYELQLTVLEPAEGKAAFWRAPVVLVP